MITQKDIDELEKNFATKFDFKEALSNLKSDIFNKLDAFIQEIRNSHEERIIISHQVSDLKDRVEKLETSHNN